MPGQMTNLYSFNSRQAVRRLRGVEREAVASIRAGSWDLSDLIRYQDLPDGNWICDWRNPEYVTERHIVRALLDSSYVAFGTDIPRFHRLLSWRDFATTLVAKSLSYQSAAGHLNGVKLRMLLESLLVQLQATTPARANPAAVTTAKSVVRGVLMDFLCTRARYEGVPSFLIETVSRARAALRSERRARQTEQAEPRYGFQGQVDRERIGRGRANLEKAVWQLSIATVELWLRNHGGVTNLLERPAIHPTERESTRNEGIQWHFPVNRQALLDRILQGTNQNPLAYVGHHAPTHTDQSRTNIECY